MSFYTISVITGAFDTSCICKMKLQYLFRSDSKEHLLWPNRQTINSGWSISSYKEVTLSKTKTLSYTLWSSSRRTAPLMDFYHDQMRVIFPVAASWTSTPVADPIRSTKRCGATDRTSSRRPPMVSASPPLRTPCRAPANSSSWANASSSAHRWASAHCSLHRRYFWACILAPIWQVTLWCPSETSCFSIRETSIFRSASRKWCIQTSAICSIWVFFFRKIF